MRVVLSPAAERDADEANAWWRQNRPDSPDLLDDEIAAGVVRLETDAGTVSVFRRVGAIDVRRVHLPKTRRHLYFVIEQEQVTVLAVWGGVRGVLPKLRERARDPR